MHWRASSAASSGATTQVELSCTHSITYLTCASLIADPEGGGQLQKLHPILNSLVQVPQLAHHHQIHSGPDRHAHASGAKGSAHVAGTIPLPCPTSCWLVTRVPELHSVLGLGNVHQPKAVLCNSVR